MKKRTLYVLLTLLLCGIDITFAQSTDTISAPASADSLSISDFTKTSDSLKLAEMAQALEEAHMNEMNLRMEMEALRTANIIQDSIKLADQRKRIDSLRSITIATPVVVEGDTLYYLYAKKGGLSPKERAEGIASIMVDLGKQFSMQPDSVYVESSDIVTDLMYKDKVIASFTDLDGLWENTTRDELATRNRLVVVNKLYQLQKAHGLLQLVKRIALFTLVIVLQIALIWGVNRLYQRIRKRILLFKDSKLKTISFRDYELFDTDKQVRILVLLSNLGRYLLILIQLIISIPILFSIFPQTENLASKLFSYIWTPVKGIGISTIEYIPNLFTIIIIWLCAKYLVKLLKYLAGEIQNEKLKINGFYPDWAQSTFQIIRFLLYAIMIAFIFPLLPGSDSQSFQGVSVFIGLVVSLGSTSVIGNILAGMVITYMRPFKIGDRIKLNDTVGNVIEKTPFVIRIRTPKNEVITMPNSFIMSSHTINYSSAARNYGLIIHSEITFGYEVHWKDVHDLLIRAAKMTPDVMQDPQPFVLETAMKDFYVVYQINAFIKEADKMPRIYSNLHQNIQDLANEAGIEMLSPHFIATRDGSDAYVPNQYQAAYKKTTEEFKKAQE